ncbi:MAG: alginate export family protein [Verrucomicrobiales bacterium]|nr:alginate export family protein [Verrucomicrobiales bacterium]
MHRSSCLLPFVSACALCLSGVALPASAQTGGSVAQAAGVASNPLSFDDGRLVFDVHFNTRLEIRDNTTDFNAAINAPNDAAWLLTRFRLGALFEPTDYLKLYVQGQDIRELGGSRPNNVGAFGADGDDVFDVLRAWLWLGKESGPSLQVGRQELNYGDQRLLGNPQWLNSSRAWDAIRFHYITDDWFLDLFTGSRVTFVNNRWNQSDYFNTHEGRNAFDSGLYFSSKTLVPWQNATDFYLLNFNFNKTPTASGAPLGQTGDCNVWTLGTRMKGDPSKLHQWDYELEVAAQLGRAAGLDQRAFAGHWGFGYNIDHAWKPRVGVQYNYATGDNDPTDGRNTTFINGFPGNHDLYGFMDTTAWMNMHNPQLNIRLQPTENLKLTLNYNLYWNATNNDGWFAANTSTLIRPVNAAATAASQFRGQEFDINAYYKLGTHFSAQAGYSIFLPGSYLAQTGASDTAHLGYLQLTVNF